MSADGLSRVALEHAVRVEIDWRSFSRAVPSLSSPAYWMRSMT